MKICGNSFLLAGAPLRTTIWESTVGFPKPLPFPVAKLPDKVEVVFKKTLAFVVGFSAIYLLLLALSSLPIFLYSWFARKDKPVSCTNSSESILDNPLAPIQMGMERLRIVASGASCEGRACRFNKPTDRHKEEHHKVLSIVKRFKHLMAALVSFVPVLNLVIFKHIKLPKSNSWVKNESWPSPRYNYPAPEAPLTFIRSESPENVRISLQFSKRFSPVEPTEPKPKLEKGSVFVWDVQTGKNGIFSVKMKETLKKVHFIWWEAQRKTFVPLDPSKSTCIRRKELRTFLNTTLTEMGLQENEKKPFIDYWEASLKRSSYVHVSLVSPKEMGKFLPKMTVQAKKAFDLHRVYFRFHTSESGGFSKVPSTQFLRSVRDLGISTNAVIDIGGETVRKDGSGVDPKKGQAHFNKNFIRDYLYV